MVDYSNKEEIITLTRQELKIVLDTLFEDEKRHDDCFQIFLKIYSQLLK